MEYIDEMAMETEDPEQYETLFSELSYLSEHPLDLNEVGEKQLKKLPFLSDRQISNIISYRKKYGEMVTIYELKNIEELDFQTIELLLPFVYIGEKKVDNYPLTVNNMLRYGSNELQIRYDRCFQQKKGYVTQPDSVLAQSPNKQYLGEPFYHSLRYSFKYGDKVQIGFVAEKDAGEPFWNEHHKGYDFYSFHFFLKDIGWLKSLAIGDYKVSFGQGLLISNDFTPSRNALVTQMERRNNGFRRHYSTNENDFFRGAAVTLRYKNMDVSLFHSNKRMDATLVDDETISTIKTDGLHRLVRDREKMRILPMTVYGGNIRYGTSDLCIGLTALSYSFGKYSLEPDPKPYNLYYFRGSDNINASIDYLIKNDNIKFYGETAISKNKAMATLNAVELTPTSYISFLLLYRYYDKKYQAYFGNAFSQNSNIQNEKGFYLGLQFTPFPYWKLSTYADIFRFPWLKYGVDAPSSGSEYMVQLDYTTLKNVSFYVRYKYRQKEKNITLAEKATVSILPYKQQRLRFQLQYGTPSVLFKTSAEGVLYNEKEGKDSKGIICSQSIGWKPAKAPIQLDVNGALFRTDDYSTRLSSYEKNILYAFNMPQLYGKGVRLSATIRWNILDQLTLSAKLASTHYTDRDTIGTDLEEIQGKTKTDIYALLQWKF